MKAIEFPVEGTVVLHVLHGNVVVRGQPGRTGGQLAAKGAIDQNTLGVQDGDTHFQVSDDLTINLPAGTPVQLVGYPDDVVLRTLGDVSLDSCQGDLVASELASFQAKGDLHGDVALRAVTGPVSLSNVHGDLAVANVAGVQAGNIEGDVRLNGTGEVGIGNIQGDLAGSHAVGVQVREIEGDVSLNGTGEVGIGKIQGDLAVSQAAGVQVREVRGDASLSNISGVIDLKRVEGDLSITTPGAAVAAADVRGDASLSGRLQPNGKYGIKAAGAVAIKMSGDVRVVVHARGQVQTGPGLLIESQSAGVLVARVGSGEQAADLNIEAGGNVVLTSLGQGPRVPMHVMATDLQKTTAQAQEDINRALEAPGVANPPRTPRPEGVGASLRSLMRDLLDSLDPQSKPAAARTAPTVAQDEVRTVLDMLAAGKITTEEADKLIEALRV